MAKRYVIIVLEENNIAQNISIFDSVTEAKSALSNDIIYSLDLLDSDDLANEYIIEEFNSGLPIEKQIETSKIIFRVNKNEIIRLRKRKFGSN